MLLVQVQCRGHLEFTPHHPQRSNPRKPCCCPIPRRTKQLKKQASTIMCALLVKDLADYVLQVVVRENGILATPVKAAVTACVAKVGSMVSVVNLNDY